MSLMLKILSRDTKPMGNSYITYYGVMFYNIM